MLPGSFLCAGKEAGVTTLDRSRFAALLPNDMLEDVSVLVVGCGTLGSYAALALAKLGVPRFTLVDPDKVGPENVATQLYGLNDVDEYKVYALSHHLHPPDGDHDDPCTQISCYPDRVEHVATVPFDHNGFLTIASLDNIDARRATFLRVDAMHHSPRWLIDPRMSLGLVEINTIPLHQPDSLAYRTYRARLFDTAQQYSNDPCGARSIAGAGMYVAGLIQAITVQLLNNKRYPYLLLSDLLDFDNGPQIRATYAPAEERRQ
jgi:hypothetical protein